MQIRFEAPAARYERGDFWQIPARTATSGVLWPQSRDEQPAPLAIIPYGPLRYLAPLALLRQLPGDPVDLRVLFGYLPAPVTAETVTPPPAPASETGTPPPSVTEPTPVHAGGALRQPRHSASPGPDCYATRAVSPNPPRRQPTQPSPPRLPRRSVIQVRHHRPPPSSMARRPSVPAWHHLSADRPRRGVRPRFACRIRTNGSYPIRPSGCSNDLVTGVDLRCDQAATLSNCSRPGKRDGRLRGGSLALTDRAGYAEIRARWYQSWVSAAWRPVRPRLYDARWRLPPVSCRVPRRWGR